MRDWEWEWEWIGCAMILGGGGLKLYNCEIGGMYYIPIAGVNDRGMEGVLV
jgi:hypothetical protein